MKVLLFHRQEINHNNHESEKIVMHLFDMRRFCMMVIGNLCIGIAVSLLRLSNFGTDPFSTMNLGVSGFLHVS